LKNRYFLLFRLGCLSLFTLLSIQSAEAAHLIGGEVSYSCEGNNLYTLSLRIYRDCAGGGASFDNTASVAIYDINGVLIRQLSIDQGPVLSLNNNLSNDPCVTVPPNLCVEYTDYIDTVRLLPILGGYTIVHQRCCRNSVIGNVINPGSYGNTYSITIPSMDTTCNSSPEITQPLDNVICLNRPAIIDIQVSESDGDSLSYELCQIFAGGGQAGGGCNSVIPVPPCPPPFNSVAFAAPFTYLNPIPSAQPFTINPITGRLSGTPGQLGIYVAGICISEWRNGQRLSTVRLDYQFAVSNCIQNVISDMKTPLEEPQILCDGLTVKFESETQNANSLLWNFGDLNTNSDTSSQGTPQYTYPSPGTYLVTLIANPGEQCSDTTFAPFTVKPGVAPQILWDGVPCFEVQDLKFEASGALPPNASFRWDFGGDSFLPLFYGKSVFGLSWATAGVKPVSLTVYWDSCSVTIMDSIEITEDSTYVDAGPDTTVIRGDYAPLRSTYAASYYWYADRPVKFDNPFARYPRAEIRDEDDTVTFFVRVTDIYGCQGTDSMQVFMVSDINEAVYNIITPNGDGLNDFFDLSPLRLNNACNLEVFNRWGAQVFSADSYQNDWEGVDNDGKVLADGTYYYVIKCGEYVEATGPISIIRYR
jgi:gliding motility-associated-like protein